MLFSSLLLLMSGLTSTVAIPTSTRAHDAALRVLPALTSDLRALGAAPGNALLLRIFKREAELEVWIKPAASDEFVLFRNYPICHFSGLPGPKTRQGDGQAPEGIYSIRPTQLNPYSQFHLSFNLGYPNAYEQGQGWTGSALMVHGNCVSVGCYAMTDPLIEQIYTLVAAALAAGQSAIPVHSFPFRMTDAALAAQVRSPHHAFWTMLAPIYGAFEQTRTLPPVRTTAAGYLLGK